MSGRRKVFVANRGEIALRIVDACDRLGIATVLGVSAADRDSLPAKRAGRTVTLGGARASESYLNLDAMVRERSAGGNASTRALTALTRALSDPQRPLTVGSEEHT